MPPPAAVEMMMVPHRALSALLLLTAPLAAETANVWTKHEKAAIAGRRWDVPLGYAPGLKRFLVLGGRISYADARKERSYDVLSLGADRAWRNELPFDIKWGKDEGPFVAPPWKDERWGFFETAGAVRPNWSVYGTFSLGQKYDYDPDTKAFYFYAGGNTFRYDPVKREWKDLAPPTHPQQTLGGILLWSSMCYDRSARWFVLFGGGNVQTERGDPGTWTYAPARNQWRQETPAKQPPQRGNSRLVYDPEAKKVVLFGGDGLDRLYSDTWTYDTDTKQWAEKKPALCPAPRAGHAMLWLPKAKKVLLLGGYTYTSTTDYVAALYRPLPLEAWTYDTAADRWDLIARWDKGAPAGPANFFLSAAVDENDTVLLLDARNQAWSCRFDVSKPDAAGGKKAGVKPGATVQRTGSHDPEWYRKAPAASPEKVGARLKALPANRWERMATLNRPGMNMDWGSAVFDTAGDRILRFSGGHSAYSGTAPVVYDVKTDRYSLPFAPEYPVEYVYSNDQVHGEWSFRGNPWMTGHTYKSTGYDPSLKALVFAAHEHTYFFDADAGKWSRSPGKAPFRPNMYVVTLCAMPDGVAAWADGLKGGAGLWRLDAKPRVWKALPLRGELPDKSPDHHGMALDSKRGRLLLFSDVGKRKGDVCAYNLRTGEAKWLGPAGAARALVPSRETTYLPELDMVLIGGRVKDGTGWLWLAYDCAKNAWVGLDLGGDDPVGKAGAFNNSVGLMYDLARKLVWAVGQYSHVYALRIDVKSMKVKRLE